MVNKEVNRNMKKTVEIIGPCSKYVDGKGWVTQIPEELLTTKGYHKVTDEQIIISKDMYKYFVACEQVANGMKLFVNNLKFKQSVDSVIDPNAQSQDGLKCIYHECDMEGNHCTAGHGITFGRCVLPFDRSFCEYYKTEEDKNGKIQRRRQNRNNKRN